MIDDHDILAASWVLGVLEAEAAAEAEALLECDEEFRAAVDAWERRLMPLLGNPTALAPPASVWDRISATLDGAAVTPGRPPVWAELTIGVTVREIWANERTGERGALFRMAPGSSIGAHEHAQDEECTVLNGSVVIDGALFRKGAIHRAPAGTTHQRVFSDEGSMLLVRWGARAA